MAVRPVVMYGDPVLTTVAAEVTEFNQDLKDLVQDLFDTMYDEDGVGMAAPQLGVSQRVFVYHVEDEVGHIVNPVLSFPDETEQTDPEGCLSIPGFYFDVTRKMNVVARGFNFDGEPIEVSASGYLARCIQHENDHLDGILYLERLAPELKSEAIAQVEAELLPAPASADKEKTTAS